MKMNPGDLSYNQMTEQSSINGHGPPGTYRNISISAVISTSCVVLEGLRPGTGYPENSGVSNSGQYLPSQDENQLSPATNFQDQSIDPYVTPYSSRVYTAGTDLYDDISTYSNFGNCSFESAASEFTTVGPEIDENPSMKFRNSYCSQGKSTSFGDSDNIMSPTSQDQDVYRISNTGVDHGLPYGVYSNDPRPHKFSPMSTENNLQFSRRNSNSCHQSAYSTSDRDSTLGHSAILEEPFMPPADNMFHIQRFQDQDSNAVDKFPISDYRNQFQNAQYPSDSRSEFPPASCGAGSNFAPMNRFRYFGQKDAENVKQAHSEYLARMDSTPLADDFCMNEENTFPANETCEFKNSFQQVSDHIDQPVSKPRLAQNTNEMVECFLGENINEPSISYNSQSDYAPFFPAAQTVDNNLSSQERSFRRSGESYASTYNQMTDTDLSMSNKDDKSVCLANEADPPKSKTVTGRKKRKHADTVESLQHHLELIEEKRQKAGPSCSSLNLIHQKTSAMSEQTNNEESDAVAVDVDHMICSGVTVAGFKPRAIIRKRNKTATPNDIKDIEYWQKRRKNNDSARKSRESKKEKEKNFYKRALELEYENYYLQECLRLAETELASLGHPFVPPVIGNHCYF